MTADTTAVNEFGDPIDDLWRTTIFSSQRTYQETVRTALGACFFLLLLLAAIFAGLGPLSDECPYGYHEPYLTEKETNSGDPFLFLTSNVCVKCQVAHCEDCLSEGGLECLECEKGYFMTDGQCVRCPQVEDGACLACAGENVCTTCAPGHVLRQSDLAAVTMMEVEVPAVCMDCSTDERCDECSNNVCTKCMPGYFMNDGDCYRCSAYMPGCAECGS